MKVLNLIDEVAKERAADSEKTMSLNINHVFTIAEAFRALEQERDELRQRAEAAEEKVCHDPECHTDFKPVYEEMVARGKRADAFEAKLAELAKQEPRYFYREHNSYNGMKTDWTEVSAEQLEHLKEITDPDTSEIIELFTRPAPAISLAELVPDCLVDAMCNLNLPGVSVGDKAIIGKAIEILRNIEQRK